MSTTSPSILDLATQIKDLTTTVHNHLQQNSLPPLSFSEDAFPFFPGVGPRGVDPFPRPSQDILDARRDLRQACETLLQLVTTPVDHSFLFTNMHHAGACWQYVYHFKIAEAVAIGKETSFKEVADRARVDERQCMRVLRMLMTYNLFHEPKPGYVGHTAGSKIMLLPNLRDTVGYFIEEGFVAAPRLSETTEKFRGSEERNHAPWNLAHGIDIPYFEFLETNPVRRKRFFGLMDNIAATEAYDTKYLVEGFNWRALGNGTVVDLGGNTGHTSFKISEVAPELRFIVQDLEKVIEGVTERTKEKKNDRIEFQVHNFFEPQPVKDADVYLLRFIFHDYPDKYAAKILQNLIPAMGKKSRIVVMDGVMPPPHILTKIEERKMRIMDMEMMLGFNAVERDIEGWEALYAKADRRLKLKSVVTPHGSAQSVMELVLSEA